MEPVVAASRSGSKALRVVAMLVWLAAVVIASVMHLIARDEPGWVKPGFWLLALAALFIAAWAYYRSQTKPRPRPEERVGAEARVGLLIVHGMGVQDRYQMLDDFARAFPTYTENYAGRVEVRRGARADSLALVVENGGTSKCIEVREAYWGYLFNRLTKLVPTLLFSGRAFASFVPGLATRFFKKRLGELAWTSIMLGLLVVLLLGIYGGFVVSANRLSDLQRPMKGLAVVDGPIPDASREQIPYLRRDDGTYLDLEGTPHTKGPDYRARVRATVAFLGEALEAGFSPSTYARAVPFRSAFDSLLKANRESLVRSVIYSVAFGLMTLSFVGFLRAQIKFWGSGAMGPKGNQRYDDRVQGDWTSGTWRSISKGIVPLAVILALDPTLDLLLVQLVVTGALLFVILKFLKWWLLNFMGDVQIYATLDENSEYFEAREKATELVKSTLSEMIKGGTYDRVILIAHSLGSVLAANAVRRCHRECPSDMFCQRFGAFVTIGSPLRKFRQLFRAMPYKWSFGDNAIEWDKEIFIGDDFEPNGRMPWFNYWYGTDIFADRLAYEPTGDLRAALAEATRKDEPKAYYDAIQAANRKEKDLTGLRVGDRRDCNLGPRPSVWSHSDYWLDHRFIDDVLTMALAPESELPMLKLAPKPLFPENGRK